MKQTALLQVRDLRAFYGRIEVLHGIDLDVRPGEIVALFGPNGAGKTTTMKSISSVVRSEGTIKFDGLDISHAAPHSVARRGIGHVPEGRGTFADLTVEDNLKVALLAGRHGRHRLKESDTAIVYDIFPKLLELRKRMAGKLSGGEQQMLAVGRAILSRPKLLLIDEPSTGLAPKLVADMYEQLRILFDRWRISALIAEQSVYHALALADRAYIIASGRVAATGNADDLKAGTLITAAYLGDSALSSSPDRRVP